MYTIGAFRKKNGNDVNVDESPNLVKVEPPIEHFVPPAPQKKDWVILTKKNIVDDEKMEDVKKNELLRVIRYNDREVILKKAYSEYMRDNEDHMRSVYEKITTMNPVYFDKLRSSDRGFLVFSRFVFSKYIFDKNNLKGLCEL